MECDVFLTSKRCVFIIDFLIGGAVGEEKAHQCPLGSFVWKRDEVVPSRTCQDDPCCRGRERISYRRAFFRRKLQKPGVWWEFPWRDVTCSCAWPPTTMAIFFFSSSKLYSNFFFIPVSLPPAAGRTSAVIIDDFWGHIKRFIDFLSLPVCSSNSLNYYWIWRLMHKHNRIQKPESKNKKTHKTCLDFIIYLNPVQIQLNDCTSSNPSYFTFRRLNGALLLSQWQALAVNNTLLKLL